MESNLNLNPLKTTQQVADILNVKIETVRRLIKTKRLKATKIGQMYRVEDSEIKDLIERQST